jgi:hypothetical protein
VKDLKISCSVIPTDSLSVVDQHRPGELAIGVRSHFRGDPVVLRKRKVRLLRDALTKWLKENA